MTAPTNTSDTTSEQDVAARLAAAEATLAEIQGRIAVDVERVNAPPPPPVPSRWGSAYLERQEAARQRRILAAREADGEAHAQAIKDAPKRAKRDAALAELTERIGAAVNEQQALERKLGDLMRERANLAGRPL